VVLMLERMSRGERRGMSSRPQYPRVLLYFLHHCLCAEEDKVSLATYMLQWSSLLHTRFEDGAVEIAWDEFVRLFRAMFVPEHIQDKMEQEFLTLTQGSMTILEYKARFVELSKYATHIVVDERRKAKKFVMGLKPSLRSMLVAFDHRTLVRLLALHVVSIRSGTVPDFSKESSVERHLQQLQQQHRQLQEYQECLEPKLE
ncbi:hypothetical protein Taro_025946, partial [Colocasia esculenta]|nr:hypothetical protein [Colocasia esculenta]